MCYLPTVMANAVRKTNRPASGIQSLGNNRIQTERYSIAVAADKVTIRDAKGGSLTVSGDMLLKTSDRDNIRVENGNVTLQLKDGTKVTFVPTANGKEISKVVVTKDGKSASFSNVDSNPKFGGVRGNANAIDANTPDGLVLTAGNRIDDLFLESRGELKGTLTLGNSATTSPQEPVTTTPGAGTTTPGAGTTTPGAGTTTPGAGSGSAPSNGTPGAGTSTPGAGSGSAPSNGTTGAGTGSSGIKGILNRDFSIDPNNPAAGLKKIDEAFDDAIKLLDNPNLGPGEAQAIQLAVSKLQNLITAISNIKKTKEESKSAIIRNLR